MRGKGGAHRTHLSHDNIDHGCNLGGGIGYQSPPTLANLFPQQPPDSVDDVQHAATPIAP